MGVLLAHHPRCGAESPLRRLDAETLRYLLEIGDHPSVLKHDYEDCWRYECCRLLQVNAMHFRPCQFPYRLTMNKGALDFAFARSRDDHPFDATYRVVPPLDLAAAISSVKEYFDRNADVKEIIPVSVFSIMCPFSWV